MPLVNGPTLTPKKLAANRGNGQLSRGPITLEGLIRMRDSKMKHGAYAQDREEALRALGRQTNAEDRMKSGAEVGGLTRSCFWPRRSQPGLVTARGKKFLKLFWPILECY